MTTNKIVLLDLDGTLLKGQSQIYLLFFMYKRGQIKTLTFLHILFWYFKYKYLDDEVDTRLVRRVYKEAITGRSVADVDFLISELYKNLELKKINANVLSITNDYRSADYKVYLVSASVDPIVSFIAFKMNFDGYVSTRLEKKNGFYTGEIAGNINEGKEKLKNTKNILRDKDTKSVAIFDSLSDVALAKIVNDVIVVSPGRKLHSLAVKNNWLEVS